jgi:hypothetical protein
MATCLYRIRIANLGAVAASLVAVTSSVSYRGSTVVIESAGNFGSLAESLIGGPGFFQTWLANLSKVTVRGHLDDDARTNEISGPVTLDGGHAQDVWLAFGYEFDDSATSVASMTTYNGYTASLDPAFEPVGVDFVLRFADGSRLSTNNLDCEALSKR